MFTVATRAGEVIVSAQSPWLRTALDDLVAKLLAEGGDTTRVLNIEVSHR